MPESHLQLYNHLKCFDQHSIVSQTILVPQCRCHVLLVDIMVCSHIVLIFGMVSLAVVVHLSMPIVFLDSYASGSRSPLCVFLWLELFDLVWEVCSSDSVQTEQWTFLPLIGISCSFVPFPV